MASPGVIDGAATPEDKYSPSKNAHCCGPSTECIVCMHAGARTHIHKRGAAYCTYARSTLFGRAHSNRFLKKNQGLVGWEGVKVDVNLPLVHMQPTTGAGPKTQSNRGHFARYCPFDPHDAISITHVSPAEFQPTFQFEGLFFVILMCLPVAVLQSMPLLGCLKFVSSECPTVQKRLLLQG